MDIFSSVVFFCIGFAIAWLVLVGFTADQPRDDRSNGGDGSYRP